MTTPKQNTVESPAMRAGNAIRGLRSLKEALAIVQAAHVMALEGQTRATANDVASRAIKDFQSNTTASVVGQFLRQMDVGVAVTHGKVRLVLDEGRLKTLKERISKACKQTAVELEAALRDFSDLSARIKALEAQWGEAITLRTRERELASRLQQDRNTPSRLPQLEQQAAKLQKEEDRAKELEKRCSQLSETIKALPSLEQREKSLDDSITKYRAWEAEIVQSEKRLGQWFEQFKLRQAWVTYVDLDANIKRQKAELEELYRQLGEKRSLLQRILGAKGR